MAIKKKIGNKRAALKTRKNVGKCRDTRGLTPNDHKESRPIKSSRSKEKLEQHFPIYNDRAETLQYEIIDVSTLDNILRDVAVCKLCHGPLLCRKHLLSASQLNFVYPTSVVRTI